jgi:hypothetical protein
VSRRGSFAERLIVSYGIVRERPRKVQTFARLYQRDIDRRDVELVVVDNGSTVPVDASVLLHDDTELAVELRRAHTTHSSRGNSTAWPPSQMTAVNAPKTCIRCPSDNSSK